MLCTTALFTWKLDATDVSRMVGHANSRIALDMYITTTGILDRAARDPVEGRLPISNSTVMGPEAPK